MDQQFSVNEQIFKVPQNLEFDTQHQNENIHVLLVVAIHPFEL